jgi:hypothetical protein
VDISSEKEGKEKVHATTPRKRKSQRTLGKINQILDNLNTNQFSKKQNILKLRDAKPKEDQIQGIIDKVDTAHQDFENKIISKLKYKISDVYLKKENDEEKIEVTPRKRKTQRTLEKIDQILDMDTPQYSKTLKI